MVKKPVVAIIGIGNLGKSLLKGLLSSGFPVENIWATDRTQKDFSALSEKYAIHLTLDNTQAIAAADVVILAVKPQTVAAVLTPLISLIQSKKPLLISVIAGVRLATLNQWLGETIPIVRVMPNTPASVACSASAAYANALVSPLQREITETILKTVGIIIWLSDEKLLDSVTAVSGSGPAYFFLIMEMLQKAAEKYGLSPEIARLLVLQTGYGAATMALNSDKTLAELRQEVTSPGGTTEAALRIFDEYPLEEIFQKALKAAKKRSEEIAVIYASKEHANRTSNS